MSKRKYTTVLFSILIVAITTLPAAAVMQATSSTHPDEARWYSSINPQLFWRWYDPTNDYTAYGYSYLLNHTPVDYPDEIEEYDWVDAYCAEWGGNYPSKTYSGLGDGVWYFHVRAYLMSNSIPFTTWSGIDRYKINIDATPPGVPTNVNDGVNGWSSDNTPTFSWGSPGDISGIAGYWWAIDDDTPETGGTWTTATTATTSPLIDGTHTFYVKAQNGSGLISAFASHQCQIDATPPGAPTNVNDGVNGWSGDNTPTFNWGSPGDISGIAGYWWAVDDNTPETGGNWTSGATATTSPLNDGTHTFYVKAQNGSGLISAFASHQCQIDATPPTGTILVNNGDGYTVSISVTLTLSASDSGSGLSKMRFGNDGVNWSIEENYATSKSWTLPTGDGTKTVYVQYKDNAGNWSGAIGDTIILDTTGPGGTILINNGGGYTNSTSVTLTLSASDSGSGVSKMRFGNDGVNWSIEENYAISKSWTLPTGDGTKAVYVQYKDNAGNWGNSISDTIILDTIVPTGTISINNGAQYTNSTSVTLTLSASDSGSGVSKMRFGNDGMSWGSEEDYATSKSWTLTSGDGTKAVYVQYKDNAGNWGNPINDTIILDTTGPGGTISINNGGGYTNSTSVTLTLSASDNGSGVSKMRFGNDGVNWSIEENYATGKSWTLMSGDGTKAVYVQYKDNAGNWGNPINDTIILDTTGPGGTISINNGGGYTNSTSVTLTLSASDSGSGVSKMRFGNDGVNWSIEENYAPTKSWTLTSVDGTKAVYVQYKDNAGNWGNSISDTIILDTMAPSGTISINSGAESTDSTSVTLTLSASDSGSGVGKMKFSNDGVNWSIEENYAPTKSWTLTSGDGTKTVYVQYKDNAGNWSNSISDTIILDTTGSDTIPPTGTISINNGAEYTNSTSVTLTLSASDSGSGVNKMKFSNNGVSWSTEEDYATSASWTLGTGDGLKIVFVQYKDNAGNWSGPTSISDTIILDTMAPSGTILINNGAQYTNSTSVTLTLLAIDGGSGVSKVKFSNEGVSWSSEDDYATSKSWTLTTGDGTKTVYVQYKDNAGNWNSPTSISDTIILDTIETTGTISINNGAEYTNFTSVTLTLLASDIGSGVSKVKFSNDGMSWSPEEDYAVSKSWTLTTGDGTKTVYVQYKDNAGNWSSFIFDTIIVDTILPRGWLVVDKDKAKQLSDGEIVGVIPDMWMEANFSKDISTGSVNGLKLIAVRDNLNRKIKEEVSLKYDWIASTTVRMNLLAGELKKNYLYQLQISSEVKDLAGNSVDEESELIFRTIMDHTKKNVVAKATNEIPKELTVTVSLEANALKEDGYLIISTETSKFTVNPEVINVANDKSRTNGWYPIQGCLWEIKVCRKSGDWMEDKFEAEVRITFPYNEDNGFVGDDPIPLREKTLVAFWLSEEDSNWVMVPGATVDREKNVVVTGEVPSFSVYALMAAALRDLSETHAYPVPWKPNDGRDETGTEGEGITFTNLSARGVIKIYTISGELVREYYYELADKGKWTWNVKTSSGEKVFSGVYIYYIESEKERKTGRLVIIR